MRTPLPLLAFSAALALALALATLPTPTTAKKETYGCPIAGLSAVCPAYTRTRLPRKLEEAGIELRRYAPGVFAYLPVNASSFGSAAASTGPALSSYVGGANEAGLHFHATAPTLLRFEPSKDFTTYGREFVASVFLDVAQAGDAPAPTSNAAIRACKTRTTHAFIANWTSASPLPGPPTGATVVGHLKRLAGHLDRAGETYCARAAWLLSYSPDSLVGGRKYFEVSLDAGRCREEGGGEGMSVCMEGGDEEDGEEEKVGFEGGLPGLRLDAE